MVLRLGAECGDKLSFSLPPVKGFGIKLAGNCVNASQQFTIEAD
jgi:hypothetical protein